MLGALAEGVRRLGGVLDEEAVFLEDGSKVHPVLQAFEHVNWGPRWFRWREADLGPPPDGGFWSVEFMALGMERGLLQIAHNDGGNYTLAIRDVKSEDPSLVVMEHDAPGTTSRLRLRLSQLLAALEPVESARPARRTSDPGWLVPAGARLLTYPLVHNATKFRDLAVSPSGARVAAGGRDERGYWEPWVAGWNLARGDGRAFRLRGWDVTGVVFLSESRLLAVREGGATVFDLERRARVGDLNTLFGAGLDRRALWAWPLTGGGAAIACREALLRLDARLRRGRPFEWTSVLPERSELREVSISPSGRYAAAVFGIEQYEVAVADVQSGFLLRRDPVARMERLAVGDDGRLALRGASGTTVRLPDGTVTPVGSGTGGALAFTADGGLLSLAYADGHALLEVRDAGLRRERSVRVETGAGSVGPIAFAPSARRAIFVHERPTVPARARRLPSVADPAPRVLALDW